MLSLFETFFLLCPKKCQFCLLCNVPTFLCILILNRCFLFVFSTQNGPDGDVKDDLDSGDEADGKKIDTEEVLRTNALSLLTTNTKTGILLQDYHTDSRTSSSNLGSFDMKRPLGGLDIQAHPGMPNAHAFSQYSQMGMHVKSHMMGGSAGGVAGGMPGGIPGGGVPGGGYGSGTGRGNGPRRGAERCPDDSPSALLSLSTS